MTDKELKELRNLRRRVEAQREEIRRLRVDRVAALSAATERAEAAEKAAAYDHLMDQGSCNDCGRYSVCGMKPRWGESVRVKCYAWAQMED